MRRLRPEDRTMERKQTVIGITLGRFRNQQISRIWTGFDWEGESCEPATGESQGDHTSLEKGEAESGWTNRIFLYRIPYSLVLYTLHTCMSNVNCGYKGCLFLSLHCICTFILSSLQNCSNFFPHVCLTDSNSRFKIYFFWVWGKITKNEEKRSSKSLLPFAFSGLYVFLPFRKTLAKFLQDEICVFAVIFLDTYFPNASLKCHYFAEATTALLNGSIKINLRRPETFSGKSQQ